MLIGYMRVSKANGSQTIDLQRDALIGAGVDPAQIYEDRASGRLDARPGLDATLKALRTGDTLVVWKLDRLGRNLRHLVNTVHDLNKQGVGFKVLTGHGASIDTTTPAGKLVFGIFAALSEFERELISERTRAGLASARARGRKGGAPFKMTVAKVRLAMAARPVDDVDVADIISLAPDQCGQEPMQSVEIRQGQKDIPANRFEPTTGVPGAIPQDRRTHAIGNARLQALEGAGATSDPLADDQPEAC